MKENTDNSANLTDTSIKLTRYSHGAGCGCKIAPSVLSGMLENRLPDFEDHNLLVGNDARDDAAVYDIGNGRAVISTADFFMPIVDDPYDFGRIASANALSDIYAMGGSPLMAIAILGWPINTISADVAGKVMEGARQVCGEAGIPLAGGHSIDNPEPVFGLAPTGMVNIDQLKTNGGAQPGDLLYLTKPLGIGILSTAQKKGFLEDGHQHIGRDLMIQLNNIGEELGKHGWVHALTDVTGFGLLGHLLELCEASRTSARLHMPNIPILETAMHYIDTYGKETTPGGTHGNWDSYGEQIELENPEWRLTLCDPQTSGGLLIAVDPNCRDEFHSLMNSREFRDITQKPIGRIVEDKTSSGETRIQVVSSPEDEG